MHANEVEGRFEAARGDIALKFENDELASPLFCLSGGLLFYPLRRDVPRDTTGIAHCFLCWVPDVVEKRLGAYLVLDWPVAPNGGHILRHCCGSLSVNGASMLWVCVGVEALRGIEPDMLSGRSHDSVVTNH